MFKNAYNRAKKLAQSSGAKVSAVGTGLTLLAGRAAAAVPAEVTTAMGEMKDDGIAVATGFLVAIIAIAAFKLMRKGT